MKESIARYGDEITGMLTGFDPLVFRGTLRSYAEGMDKCRTLNRVLLRDFGHYAEPGMDSRKTRGSPRGWYSANAP